MWGSGRFLSRRVDSIPKLFSSRPNVRFINPASKEGKEKIVIPARIEREPTDILKALASTIDVDPTAFHYKYPDDPYFYAYSTFDKRSYALALESGRKSAEWVFKENPGFFKHVLSDPPVEAFLPKTEAAEEVEFTEKLLLRAIEKRDVLNAIKVYKGLKSNNQNVEKSTKQSLLELVCFYNSEERPEPGTESKWFIGYLGTKEVSNQNEKTWNASGFAQELFEEMDPNCPLAVSAMILGMLKHHMLDSSLALYQTAREKRMRLSVDVYNAILARSPFLARGQDFILEFVKSEIHEMSEQKVKPNLGTLNSVLRSLSFTSHSGAAQGFIKDFNLLGIEPSLGSYGYFFLICGKGSFIVKARTKYLVREMMTHIENQDHEILHPSDLEFFGNSMEAFVDGFQDADLALRLADFYFKPNNMKFMARASDEQMFFKRLFFVVFRSKPIDVAMDVYRRNIFTRCGLEPNLVEAILQAIRNARTPEYLAEFWKDCKGKNFAKKRFPLSKILPLVEDLKDEESNKVFHEAAISYVSGIKEFLPEDEDLVPHVLRAFINNDDRERILNLIKDVKRNAMLFASLPESLVNVLLEYAISKEDVPLILESLVIASDLSFGSTGKLAEKALPLLRGDDEIRARALITKMEELNKLKEKEKKKTDRAEPA